MAGCLSPNSRAWEDTAQPLVTCAPDVHEPAHVLLEDLVAALSAHASRAQSLAEALRIQNGKDGRSLIAPLASFESSLCELRRGVLDTIGILAASAAETSSPPSWTPERLERLRITSPPQASPLTRSEPWWPRHLAEAAAQSQPCGSGAAALVDCTGQAACASQGCHVELAAEVSTAAWGSDADAGAGTQSRLPGPSPPPSMVCSTQDLASATVLEPQPPAPELVGEAAAALLSQTPDELNSGEEARPTQTDPTSGLHGRDRVEMLRLVGSMLQRKRTALARAQTSAGDDFGFASVCAAKLRELEEEIQRVEAELANETASARTPQKHRHRAHQLPSRRPRDSAESAAPAALEPSDVSQCAAEGDVASVCADRPCWGSPSPGRTATPPSGALAAETPGNDTTAPLTPPRASETPASCIPPPETELATPDVTTTGLHVVAVAVAMPSGASSVPASWEPSSPVDPLARSTPPRPSVAAEEATPSPVSMEPSFAESPTPPATPLVDPASANICTARTDLDVVDVQHVELVEDEAMDADVEEARQGSSAVAAAQTEVCRESLSGEVLFGSARSGVGSGVAAEASVIPRSPAASRSVVAAAPAIAAPPRSPVVSSPPPKWATPKTGASVSASSGSSCSSGDLIGPLPASQGVNVAVHGLVPPLPIPFSPPSGGGSSSSSAPPPKAAAAAAAPPLPEGTGLVPTSSAVSTSVQRSSSTPNRRVPASFCSAGLFRETPSPRVGMPLRGSPVRMPTMSSLFASPSPPRYSGSELDPSDWASPIHPSLARSSQSSVAPASLPASPARPISSGSPLPPPRQAGGQGQPPPSPPVPGPMLRAGHMRSPSAATPPSASPAGRRAVAASHHIGRSPSAPSLGGAVAVPTSGVSPGGAASASPSSIGVGAPSTTAVASGATATLPLAGHDLGSGVGDTPRNLTDWRRSMQGWKRPQDDNASGSRSNSRPVQRAPWR